MGVPAASASPIKKNRKQPQKTPTEATPKLQEAATPRATVVVEKSIHKEQEDIWNYRANETNTHDRRFTMNSIRTTKYTILTFLPKNLFLQFSKMANVYFLFIMILQILPPISITSGQPAILLPLLFVCAVSAIKDMFEDIKRHNADNQENNRKTEVLNS